MSFSKPIVIFKLAKADSSTPVPKFDGSKTDSSRPLVLLLGWVGSSNKQLDKYSNMWTEKGYNTLQYPTPFLDFGFPYFTRFKSARMLREVRTYLEAHRDCKSIIIHMFSNGGGFNYAHILHLVQTKEFAFLRKYIRGVIFDSLPTLSAITALRAFRMSTPTWLFALLVLMGPLLLIQYIPFIWNYYSTLASKNNRWPHLFLYSKADSMVTPYHVETFKKQLTDSLKDDSLIQSKCFADSEHVLHLRKYPVQYKHQIDLFITNVEHNNPNKSSKL